MKSTNDTDARGRLIREVRDDGDNTRDYDLAYTYDQGGNRLKKIDAVNDVEVQYHYDLADPARYGSANNRLVYYETLDTEPDPPVLASTTWYYYSILGNPAWIVTKESGSNAYSATRFGYARNGETVTMVLGENWTWDGQSSCEDFQSYDITFAREFRYDSGRARYLNRELDPGALEASIYTALSETWSDYDSDGIYGDFTVGSGSAVTNARSLQPGQGTVDPWSSAGSATTTYFHPDHLGTLRQTTGASGSGLRVFTAFGEPITGQGDRYGYVGGWGYQAHDGFAYQHVGARYYDPSSGRFLQRDPIGLAGELNVYTYLWNNPVIGIDPDGLTAVAVPLPVIGGGGAITGSGAVVTGAAGVVVVGGAIVIDLTIDVVVAISHYERVKRLREQVNRLDDFISDQLEHLRDVKDPKIRERIIKTIRDAKRLADRLRDRMRDIACG